MRQAWCLLACVSFAGIMTGALTARQLRPRSKPWNEVVVVLWRTVAEASPLGQGLPAALARFRLEARRDLSCTCRILNSEQAIPSRRSTKPKRSAWFEPTTFDECPCVESAVGGGEAGSGARADAGRAADGDLQVGERGRGGGAQEVGRSRVALHRQARHRLRSVGVVGQASFCAGGDQYDAKVSGEPRLTLSFGRFQKSTRRRVEQRATSTRVRGLVAGHSTRRSSWRSSKCRARPDCDLPKRRSEHQETRPEDRSEG
ncbi:hypothetical protein U1Q18_052284 [Sarracenia purpurea var. burkii]